MAIRVPLPQRQSVLRRTRPRGGAAQTAATTAIRPRPASAHRAGSWPDTTSGSSVSKRRQFGLVAREQHLRILIDPERQRMQAPLAGHGRRCRRDEAAARAGVVASTSSRYAPAHFRCAARRVACARRSCKPRQGRDIDFARQRSRPLGQFERVEARLLLQFRRTLQRRLSFGRFCFDPQLLPRPSRMARIRTRRIKRSIIALSAISCQRINVKTMSSPTPLPLVLASASPYRKALLERLGLPFTIEVPRVDESALPGETPAATAMRLAEAKARAVAAVHPAALIIGSDQVAACDGIAVGKPRDRSHALEMLRAMRGRTIIFHTALCAAQRHTGRVQNALVDVASTLRPLGDHAARGVHRSRPAARLRRRGSRGDARASRCSRASPATTRRR